MTSLPLSNLLNIDNQPAIQQTVVSGVSSFALSCSAKWTYLIANNVKFNQPVDYAIAITRPSDDILFVWLEKLISSQQCSTIFVEHLNTADSRFKHIDFLCRMYKVALLSLQPHAKLPENVVIGPWNN